ncbi:MAG: PqqD family protein, partial [Elusimicrobia bacterium]|nr:PqqD family protein [Elusimicrobiota bacterium]
EEVAKALGKYVKFREEKFGGVIFETMKEKVFVVNAVGAEIVKLAGRGLDLRQAVAQLREVYESGEGVIERDVSEFVNKLRQEGLLAQP